MELTRVLGSILLSLVLTVTGFALAVVAMRRVGYDQKTGKASSRSAAPLVVGLLMNLLILAGTLAIYAFVARRPLEAMGFEFDGRDLAFSILILFVTSLLAYLIVRRQSLAVAETLAGASPAIKPNLPGLQVMLAVTLFAAALQEEVLYRGMLVTLLWPYGLLVALLVSSLLFTLVHFVTSKIAWQQAVNWFVGGLTLFAVYIFSGSVWVAALVHLSRNLANSFILTDTPGVSFIKPRTPLSEKAKLIYYTLLSLIVILLALFWYASLV
jgi:membrane protease YdiL (CAAX protease family)